MKDQDLNGPQGWLRGPWEADPGGSSCGSGDHRLRNRPWLLL